MSFYWLYYGFQAFYLLALGQAEHLFQLGSADGGVGVAVHDVDASDVGGFQSAFLAEESDDVALRYLVLLALADVDGGVFRWFRTPVPPYPRAPENRAPARSQATAPLVPG